MGTKRSISIGPSLAGPTSQHIAERSTRKHPNHHNFRSFHTHVDVSVFWKKKKARAVMFSFVLLALPWHWLATKRRNNIYGHSLLSLSEWRPTRSRAEVNKDDMSVNCLLFVRPALAEAVQKHER
jgi:hypothetical protein